MCEQCRSRPAEVLLHQGTGPVVKVCRTCADAHWEQGPKPRKG